MRRLMTRVILALAVLGGIGVGYARAGFIVVNGGFEEDPAFKGWTETPASDPNTTSVYDAFGTGYTLNFAARFGAIYTGFDQVPSILPTDASYDAISQLGDTEIGKLYNISFYLANENLAPGVRNFKVYWDGISVFDVSGEDPFGYTFFQITNVAATQIKTELRFQAYNNGSFYLLDDVMVEEAVASVVPEPASVAMLSLGMLSLLGYRWRHRKKTST